MKTDLQRTDEVFVLYVKLFPSHLGATILYQMSTRLGFNVGDLCREHEILRGETKFYQYPVGAYIYLSPAWVPPTDRATHRAAVRAGHPS